MYGELSDESVEEFESPAENSRKSTHLISADTDNAGGLVVVLCCVWEWNRRIQHLQPIDGEFIRKMVHP